MSSAAPPSKFPFPWGLLIVLAVYGALVVGYIDQTYWESPEYQSAKAYARSIRLLGVDDGRSCSKADLEKAFGLMLESARLTPEDPTIAAHVEKLRWRAEERKLTLPVDLLRHAELVSANAHKITRERAGWLPTSSRDRGWAMDQVLEGPTRTALWSIPGAVLILALWVYTRVSTRLARSRARMDEVDRVQEEVEELGAFRRRVPDDDSTDPGE